VFNSLILFDCGSATVGSLEV